MQMVLPQICFLMNNILIYQVCCLNGTGGNTISMIVIPELVAKI